MRRGLYGLHPTTMASAYSAARGARITEIARQRAEIGYTRVLQVNGLGVGSFDGKSGTAIGVMGKFGASTLLNAGFSSGGGETSTRTGISWEW